MVCEIQNVYFYTKNTVNNRSCHGTFLFQEHLNSVCAHFIHSSLIFAFSMGKNERDVEQKKEERAQKSKIYTQSDAIIREVKSTVEFRQMSVLKT